MMESPQNWKTFKTQNKPIVCIQGLGFVGTPMAIAVACAKNKNTQPCFNVIGIDLPTTDGLKKISLLNQGKLPFSTTDTKLEKTLEEIHQNQNFFATWDPEAYSISDIILVDVHCDVDFNSSPPKAKLDHFKAAIQTIGMKMKPGALIIVETTVPPGTCLKLVAPTIESCLKERKLPSNAYLLAHSYERVMPGPHYLDSIINFWRVFAGATPEASHACENFLSQIINTQQYPLTCLKSPTDSETAKVLENSYRAMTIAFMEEWGKFAEAVGVDLFDVISAIRKRPTHNNIRQPGFGVGGYCLTKDPLLANVGAREFFNREDLEFPLSTQAVKINQNMPLTSLNRLKEFFSNHSFEQKKILLLGTSYRSDVGDTRYSPSEVFYRSALQQGAEIDCQDPMVSFWPELGLHIETSLPKKLSELKNQKNYDALVFAVSHPEYTEIEFETWLDGSRPIILDANNVLTQTQRKTLNKLKIPFASIGRGSGL